MPYITQADRMYIDSGCDVNTPGELNYLLTTILLDYRTTKGESYQTYNDIVGVLEACKLEFYRRHVSLYEDQKIEENGDVV